MESTDTTLCQHAAEALRHHLQRVPAITSFLLVLEGSENAVSNAALQSLCAIGIEVVTALAKAMVHPREAEKTLVAELTGDGVRWSVPLLTVKKRRWRSY